MASEGGFTRRQVVTGAVGVGAASVLGVTIARAQSSTPSATSSPGTSGSSGTTASAGTAHKKYTDFVDKLAANLGNLDAAKVDAAIRTTLKQMVDEELQAGNISAKQATALKNRIDSGDFPADLPLFGLRGRPGPGGGMRRRRLERGGENKNGKNEENQGGENNATPAATPSTT